MFACSLNVMWVVMCNYFVCTYTGNALEGKETSEYNYSTRVNLSVYFTSACAVSVSCLNLFIIIIIGYYLHLRAPKTT